MKVLILGGTKFFGLDFAHLCAENGCDVSVFSRSTPKVEREKIKHIQGDRSSKTELQNLATQTWDVVLDNICFTPKEAEEAVSLFQGKVGLWLFVSTGDAHLTVKGATSPFTEDMCEILEEDENVRKNNLQPYGQGKRDAEKVLLKAYKSMGFPACIVRFPIVIGPRDPKIRAYSYWLRIIDGQPIILPDGGLYYRRYIYSKDCARALYLLTQKGPTVEGEIFHFGDSTVITLKEWLMVSANILGEELKTVDIPAKWLRENDYCLDTCSPYYFEGNYVLSTVKAENKLNWKSTYYWSWMKDTVNWYFTEFTGEKPKNYQQRNFELELISKWQTRHLKDKKQ
jgi:nucleoside-diphosphate-sugar epimerase